MGRGLFGLIRDTDKFFVGSYGSELTRGVYVFEIDKDNGEIIKRKYYKSMANPSFMMRRERFIYACYKNNSGRETDGGVWQYAAMDIQFGLTARVSDEGKTYEHCYILDDGTCLYCADSINGEVAVVPVKKLKVVKVVQTIKHSGSSIDPKKQDRSHPVFINGTIDQKHIVVCDLGADEIVFYDILEKGRIKRNDELSFRVKAGNGPRKLLYSNDGNYAYILNEIANTIEVYTNNDNHLELIQTIDTYPKDEFDGFSCAGDMIIMESKPYIFVTNRGHDSIGVFKILSNGTLKYIEFVDTDENPKVMDIFEEKWLVVASQKGGSIESWEIKTNDRHGVLFETHYSYPINEPVTLVRSRNF